MNKRILLQVIGTGSFKHALKSMFVLALLLLCSGIMVHGANEADGQVRKGRRLFRKNQLTAAEQCYRQALTQDSMHFGANLELGILYAQTNRYEKAYGPLRLAEVVQPKDTTYELYYHLGRSAHQLGYYDEAIKAFKTFEGGLEEGPSSANYRKKVNQYLSACRFALANANNPSIGSARNLGTPVNSAFSEYIPVFLVADSVLLYTRRSDEGGRKIYHDLQPFEDVYVARVKNDMATETWRFEDQSIVKGGIKNTREHESVVDISQGGDTLLLFRKNILWLSTLKDGNWGAPEKLPSAINRSKYQRHATFSPDGKTIWFSSLVGDDRTDFDLYSATWEEGTGWSDAVNMGPQINTDGDEDSPMLSADGKTLHFASTGHSGYGGYDLFKVQREGEGWGAVQNMGMPVNSPADDLYFKYVSQSQAYFASNRLGGAGLMDIYMFEPYGQPEFRDCEPYENIAYTITLDASESVDENGVDLEYIWDMGDGSTMEGMTFDYTYHYPGTYLITLSVRDTVADRIVHNEKEIPVVIDDVTHIEPYGPAAVKFGNEITLTSEKSMVQGGEITHVFWKEGGDGEVIPGNSFTKTWPDTGRYSVQMEVLALDSNGQQQRYCTTHWITVNTGSEEDLLAGGDNGGNPNGSSSGGDGIDEIPLDDGTIELGDNIIPWDGTPDLKLEPAFFDFDRSNIRKDAQEALMRNIKTLKENPDLVIKVSAHTDAKGSDRYNIRLSRRRAQSTVDYLVKQGIDRKRIKAVVYLGESKPAAPNELNDGSDNPTGRQLNRRAEFEIVGRVKK